ncbi:MAG: hypothetical protein RIR65_1993 [Planctomycetota bacterium]
MLALMLLQGAPLLAPLHLSDAPPPVRCAQHILLLPEGAEGDEARRAAWTRLEAEARAIVERLEAGADFSAEAAAHSDAPDARSGACLGSLPQGVLAPAFEDFLWRAKPWERSAPIATDGALHILRRVPERVGVRMIVVPREDRARAAEVALALLRGEDFAELAARHNDDPLLKARAGRHAVLERGPRDTLLKKLAFELEWMRTSEPQDLPIGLAWVRAEDPASWPPELVEQSFVRLRALLVAFEGARGAPAGARAQPEAKRFIDELRARVVEERADFAKLCEAYSDELVGRARQGDLGWVHRDLPGCPDPLVRSMVLAPGALSEVLHDPRGFWLVRRER